MSFFSKRLAAGLNKACALFSICLLGACTAFNYAEPDAPLPLRLTQVSPLEPVPRIALVLGSGGPRGYAHLGVLNVLEEAGIVPDLVVGSSVGALIGAFWADGLTAAQLTEQALSGGPFTLFDPNLFADRGWIRGERLQRYVQDHLKNGPQLQQLPRRIVIVATERPAQQTLHAKEARYFMHGNAAVAVRASSAVAGVISPVGISGIEFEDADESLPVAVAVAKRLGARFVIAVDVSALPGSTPPGASESRRQRDLARATRIAPETAQADFVLHPNLGYDASPFRSYFVQALAIGAAHARAQLPLLQKRLQGVPP
ncbi:MAG: family protein RssA [Pseudomonadota bacterium]|jgi:NTE family protein